MLLAELVDTSQTLRSTPGRRDKVERLATLLRRLEPGEIGAAVAYLSGDLRQRQIGVGWAALREVGAPAAAGTLTVGAVDAACEAIGACAGAGSQARRRELLDELFGQATACEQQFLRELLGGELRHGALEGVMAEAVARAAGVPTAALRSALMLGGDLGVVAGLALTGGADALAAVRLEVGRPLQPMLAQTATDVGDALARLGTASVEWKLDGVRVQLHRDGGEVAVFTRTLDDITPRVPELVETMLSLPVRAAVLDGEAIALRPDGRPHPFQVTSSRFGSQRQRGRHADLLLSTFLFDVLHVDGDDLLGRPAVERAAALAAVAPQSLRVPRIETAAVAEAEAFLVTALERGHEGVMVKSLEAPYEAGRRGSGWFKVKPVLTLDLVVLAAEWGHGRRRGRLSNLHLGARDPAGGFVMLGKTFKGLTDVMLAWQTERLLELETSREDWVVRVRPELVVEIAFDGVQASSRYPGGVALRFARVKGYRTDKKAEDADTIDAIRAIHAGGLT